MKALVSKLTLFIFGSFMSTLVVAQEKGLDVNINVNKQNDTWYQQPWVWVVGGAIFILLLVAMLRSGKK